LRTTGGPSKHSPKSTTPACAIKGGFAAFCLMALPPRLFQQGNMPAQISPLFLSYTLDAQNRAEHLTVLADSM